MRFYSTVLQKLQKDDYNAVYRAVRFFNDPDTLPEGEPRLCTEYEGCNECEKRIHTKALEIIQLQKEQSNAEINAGTQ
jgi:hypothetical protein